MAGVPVRTVAGVPLEVTKIVRFIPPEVNEIVWFGASSRHLSIDRRRAFMKKFETVLESRPSWRAIVICISFEGLLVS